MTDDRLHRIVLPYAVCGVIERDGTIVEVAPIVAWSRGKPLTTLVPWVRGKGGTMKAVIQANLHLDTANERERPISLTTGRP